MTNKQRQEIIRVAERIELAALHIAEQVKEMPEFPNTHMLIANLNKIHSEIDYIAGEVEKSYIG